MRKRAEQGDEKAMRDISSLDAPVNVLIWNLFATLNGVRDSGMGISALRISEMAAALDLYGIGDPSQRRRFVRQLIAMDCVWREWQNKHG